MIFLDLLLFAGLSLCVLFTTILIHEVGHGVVLKRLNAKSKMNFSIKDFSFDLPNNLSNADKINVLLAGVVAGWVSLFAWFVILPWSIGWLLVLVNAVIYWFGSRHDVKLIVYYQSLEKRKV